MKIEIKNRWDGSVLFSCEALNMGVAVKLAIEAKADLSRANLSEADLSGANLSEADLSGANLSWADLSRASLSGADLSRANLSGASLSRANLSGASLSRADLSGADLSGANLDYSAISMWCGTLKGVKVDFSLICQMLLHVFALDCPDKRFIVVKKVIKKYAELSSKWHYYEEKKKEN